MNGFESFANDVSFYSGSQFTKPKINNHVKASGFRVEQGSENALGFGGGIGAGIDIIDGFGLNFAALYFKKHEKYSFVLYNTSNAREVNASVDLTYNHLVLPVMARFNLYDLFYVGLGYYYAHNFGKIHLKATTKNELTGQTESLDTKTNMTNTLASDHGIAAGIAAGIPLNSFHIGVDFRYHYGLDKNEDDEGNTKETRDLLVLLNFRLLFK